MKGYRCIAHYDRRSLINIAISCGKTESWAKKVINTFINSDFDFLKSKYGMAKEYKKLECKSGVVNIWVKNETK